MKKAAMILFILFIALLLIGGCAQRKAVKAAAEKEAMEEKEKAMPETTPEEAPAVNTAAEPQFEETDVDLGDIV